MDNFFPILKKCSLFEHISNEKLAALLTCLGATVKQYGKKETIMEEGIPARYIGIVLSGGVQLVQLDYYGNRTIVSTAGPSELFAESFACAEVSSIPLSVIAAEPSEVMLLDCHRIVHSCSNACDFHQQMIYNLLKNVAAKNIQFHQKIEITSRRSTREKLMTYLTLQAKKAGAESFDIPFDRQELADYLEVERSGLSAEISKLRNEGVLLCHRNHFELL